MAGVQQRNRTQHEDGAHLWPLTERQTLQGRHTHGPWKTAASNGALRLTGMAAPMVLDGAMNGEAFLAYVEHVLALTLSPGDVVIMDIQPARKASGIREAIEKTGATLR